jgi:hypothetical protein
MRTRLRGILPIAALLAITGGAQAELLKFEETQSGARASVAVDGKPLNIEMTIARPQKPVAGAALFLETNATKELAPLALSLGMAVVALELEKIPPATRAQTLRDLAPRLREAAHAKRIVAHGRGETVDALLAAGALLDGLLLERDEPFAAPVDPRGPKVIELFGSNGYWRPGLAAIGAEAMEGVNRRRFFIAGAAQTRGATENCAAPVNARSFAPALRALFVALDEWTKGVKPPPSRAPRLHESGLASANALAWPKIPALPKAPSDLRPVPAIDADGNETAGLRLPDHALPVATYTGFNAQKDVKGPPCVAGAAIPFASTGAEREKTSDPRPSLVERYGSRAYFVATMRAIADKLVKERLLLKEDADAYVAAAKGAPF